MRNCSRDKNEGTYRSREWGRRARCVTPDLSCYHYWACGRERESSARIICGMEKKKKSQQHCSQYASYQQGWIEVGWPGVELTAAVKIKTKIMDE